MFLEVHYTIMCRGVRHGILCYNQGKQGDTVMETIATVVKYIFVVGVSIEVALILRALVVLARGKARAATRPAPIAEE
jgi:hypothetical protein